MRILVTGGAGFIGSHLCEALLKDSRIEMVLCVDNFNDFYSPKTKEDNIKDFLGNKKFRLYKADVRDYPSLKKIFQEEKIDTITHLAAMPGVRTSIENPWLYADVNINGTINLLELSREFNIKNFVFTSSSSVYGNSEKVPFSEEDNTDRQISPYGVSKKSAELFCHNYHKLYGLNITCLRLFTVCGPKCRPDLALYKFVDSLADGRVITMYGDGTTRRDYTYVSDVVDAILKSIEKKLEFEIINIGNSHPTELRDFISLIEKFSGKKAKIKKMPVQPGDVMQTYADISKAKRLLNWQPKTDIETGIKNFVEWYNGKKP